MGKNDMLQLFSGDKCRNRKAARKNTWEDIPGIEVQARLMQMGGIKKQSVVALFWNILIIMRFPRYHEGKEMSLLSQL